MLVLHGLWFDAKGFCLWAEDSDRPLTDLLNPAYLTLGRDDRQRATEG